MASLLDAFSSFFGKQEPIKSPIAAGAGPAVSSSGPPPQYYQNPGAYPLTQAALNPISNPAPRQTTQTSSGPGNGWNDAQNIGYLNGQVYRDKNQWLKAGGVPQIQNSMPQPQGVSQADIDSIYNPIMEGFRNQENTLNTQARDQESLVNQSFDLQNQTLQQQEVDAQKEFEKKNQLASENKASAYEEAIRSYNSLKQQRMSQFGSGSGGDALGEIANSEFFRQQGSVNKQFASILDNLLVAKTQTEQTFRLKKNEFDLNRNQQLLQVRQAYQQALDQLSTQRFQVESQKAQARLDIKREYDNYARQVQLAYQQQNQALETWKAQQQYLIENKLINQFTNLNTNITLPQNQLTTQKQQPQSSIPQNLKYNPNTDELDIYGNVITK